MDFLTKFLQRKPPKSGGGSPAASSTPTVPTKPDHEAHVQFAREFVVELVETVPKKSEKAALAKVGDKEDIVSLKSVSPSESSFQSVNSVTENTSLPDLLQPESVYKKQTDTDTDTTEYESAAETDPSDASSPIENLIAEDIITGFHEALDKKYSSSEAQKPSSDKSSSQTSEPSPLSEAYEDVGDAVVKSGGEDEVKSLDISGLCLFVSNLCLDSPKRSEESDSPESQKNSSNNSSGIVVNNSVVTEQSFGSVSDSTFVVEDKCTEVNKGLGESASDWAQIKVTTQVDSDLSSKNLPTVIPENVCALLGKSLEQNSLESTVSETTLLKQESENTSEVKPEVTSPKPHEVLTVESPVIKEAKLYSESTPSAKFPEELPLNSAEINQVEVSSQNNLEVKSKHTEILKEKSTEIKQAESLENIPEVIPKFTEALLVKPTEDKFEKTEASLGQVKKESEETQEISPAKSDKISSGDALDLLTKSPGISSVKPVEVSQVNKPETKEVKSNEISEIVDSLVKQTVLSSEPTYEELPIKPIKTLSEKTPDIAPIKSTEVGLKNLELPVKLVQILENTVEATSVIPTKIPEENFEVLQVKPTETFPTNLEVSATSLPEISPKTPIVEFITLTETSIVLPAKHTEESAKTPEVSVVLADENTSERTNVKHTEEIKVLEITVKQEEPVVSEIIQVQTLKSVSEGEVSTYETADTTQELTSEVDFCSSESIPVEETPSATSVTNSIEDKLLESKDFSTSFEVLSIDREVPSELCEDKVQIETVDSGRELSQNRSLDKVLNSSAELGAGDYKFQQAEKEVEVNKKAPTVLTELFEICNRQQKDLELGDEKFVDGREFFDTPSNSANSNETVVVSDAQTELSKTVTVENYGDFDDSITEEAEKIYQEILNASSHLNDTSVKSSDITLQGTSKMADVRGGFNSVTTIVDDNPFVTQSSLRRSPPPSVKASPRSSSQGPSPADSPRTRSKFSSVNDARESSLTRDGTGDASPRSKSGKNSPDCRISSNRVSSLEGSPKNSVISSEINQSEAGPDIAEEAHVQGGDVFKDPSTFDFLNSLGNSNIATDLRKESLYVKFDPLVGGARTIDQSVPLPPAVEAKSNNIGPSASSSPHESFSNNITPPRNIAMSVVDKLISLSPSPRKQQVETPVKQVVTPVSSPIKESYPDNSSMVEELYLLREILAKQDEKHREDILMQQHKLEHLQAQLKEYEEREARLNKKVAEKSQGQKQMSIIMEEYEKTISRLVAEKEQEKQAHELDRAALLKERDTAMGHLANIEIAFSDLHKKYERSKTVIEGFKKNEEVLRASLAEYEATIRKQEQKYDVLKSHAMAQLENANQELDSVKRSQQADAAKLKAMLKKAEVKTSSLEEMLEQKVKENQELASICDELISKVGSSE